MIAVRASFPQGFAPERASTGAAGFDLRAHIDTPVVLRPRDRGVVPTGVRIELPHGYEAQVRPRSGLAFKYGVTVLNAPGTIDSDYRGEISVALINTSAVPYTIERGDRIAQLVVAAVAECEFVRESLSESERGEGGFGSTGR